MVMVANLSLCAGMFMSWTWVVRCIAESVSVEVAGVVRSSSSGGGGSGSGSSRRRSSIV